MQISFLQSLAGLFLKDSIEKAVLNPFWESSPISVNIKTSPFMHLHRVIHIAPRVGTQFKLSMYEGV